MILPEIYCRSLYAEADRPWRFELTKAVTITLSSGVTVTIPVWYKTDFATVPRSFRGIIWGAGNHNLAVLIHDWLYDNRIGTRKSADKEMLHWLLKSGCSKVKAYTMYFACRVGGKKWWDS